MRRADIPSHCLRRHAGGTKHHEKPRPTFGPDDIEAATAQPPPDIRRDRRDGDRGLVLAGGQASVGAQPRSSQVTPALLPAAVGDTTHIDQFHRDDTETTSHTTASPRLSRVPGARFRSSRLSLGRGYPRAYHQSWSRDQPGARASSLALGRLRAVGRDQPVALALGAHQDGLSRTQGGLWRRWSR